MYFYSLNNTMSYDKENYWVIVNINMMNNLLNKQKDVWGILEDNIEIISRAINKSINLLIVSYNKTIILETKTSWTAKL